MNRRHLRSLSLAPLVGACAAHGPIFSGLQPPARGKAVIYVYRTQMASRSMNLAPALWVAGQRRGSVLLDGYIRTEVDPGLVEVSLRTNSYLWAPPEMPEHHEHLSVEPTHSYFLRFSIDH